jgi:hypothetical protein
MKKRILFFIGFLGIVLTSYAQYPIPSYNVPVFPNATFKDQCKTTSFKKDAPMRKRRIIVQTSQLMPDSGSNVITVYVCRLDKSIILGPFYMDNNSTISVEIDDQEWGVAVHSQNEIDVSVWIEEYGALYHKDKDWRQLTAFLLKAKSFDFSKNRFCAICS